MHCRREQIKPTPVGAAATAILLAASWAAPSRAQHFNASDAPCRGVTQTVALVNCFNAAAQTANDQLDKVYFRVTKQLAANERERVEQAERRWIDYRDAFCDAEYRSFQGGTGGSPARLACVEALTRHHNAELEAAFR